MDLKTLDSAMLAKVTVGVWTFDFVLLANIALHYLGVVKFIA